MNSAPISAPPSSVVHGPGQFNAPGYSLHSDLAQFCLPAASRDAYRKLAYVNSICSLFLAIGLAGINPPVLEQRVPEPVQQFVPVEIVQPPEPPKTEPQPQEQDPQPQPDTPVLMPQVATVVAADPTQVKFAVPVEGPVVFAPAKFAQAPPPAPPKPATRSEEHTSELQSQSNLVCRLLLEKKKIKQVVYARYLQASHPADPR